MANSNENSGSFADCQTLYSGNAFYVFWDTYSNRGAFCLNEINLDLEFNNLGWRVALCS